jgi:hypothetical protein
MAAAIAARACVLMLGCGLSLQAGAESAGAPMAEMKVVIEPPPGSSVWI